MITNCLAFVRRILNDQRGQVLPWVTGGMFALIGMAGLTIDIGHAYAVRDALQNGTNAAALAAASAVYTTQSQIVAAADAYASTSGGANYLSYATGTPTVTPTCINMLMPGHSGCEAYGSNLNASCAYRICNAVQVTQTASVPTYFLGVLGIHTIGITTTGLASFNTNGTSGSSGGPPSWNIAIIEDATGSMANTDTNCPGSPTEFACALNMIQTILSDLNPCPSGMSSCTPAQANVRVALFTFPNMLTSYLPNFYKSGCSNSLTSITPPAPYQVMTLPKENASSYTPLSYTQATTPTPTTWTASYELTYGANTGTYGDSTGVDAQGFVSDYYSPGNATTGNLNPNSPLVRLVGYGGTAGQPGTGSGGTSQVAGCMPISESGIDLNGATNVGATIPSITSSANGGTQQGSTTTVNTLGVGEGITYYAAAIYAAQAALTKEASVYPGSANAIILLSDGQANTQWIYFPAGSMKPGAVNTPLASTLATGSTGYDKTNSNPLKTAIVAAHLSSPNGEVSGAISGIYPDFMDECQQAIVAAQYAASATNAASQATKVIAVSYGSEDTGCGSGATDAHNDVTTVATGNNASFTASTLTPCGTMENIADNLADFYSDYLQSGSGIDATCINSANNSVNSLTGIGMAIASNFHSTTLLPSTAH